MTDKKPLLEHQKRRLEIAIDEISTPIFSTKTPNVSDNQRFSRLSDTYSAKSQPKFLSLDYMATPEIPYTIPKLVKGKRVTTVPKGSTWAREEAKQSWYVEFFFHDAEKNKMIRFRPTKSLNGIAIGIAIVKWRHFYAASVSFLSIIFST